MSFSHVVVDELLAPLARTTSGVSQGINKGDVREGLLLVEVSAVSGTSPTLDVKLQTSPDGASWFDLPGGALAQITASGNYALKVANFGRFIRVAYSIGGTTPSFAFKATFVGKT